MSTKGIPQSACAQVQGLKFKVSSLEMGLKLVKKLGTLNMEL
jgi:hypothetical protein